MDKELKAKWVNALRSGKYQQTTNTLRDPKGLCCLGVLLDVSGMGEWEDSRYSYENDGIPTFAEGDLCGARAMLDIAVRHEIQLVRMNDGSPPNDIRPHSFGEIADYVEANL